MPESRRRKPKAKRTRQRFAERDGETIAAPGGCCDGMTVELAVGRLNIHHDDECPSLDDAHPEHVSSRVRSNAAAASTLAARGLGPVTVVIRR